MAMGKRKPKQQSIWVPAAEMARSDGHPFYAQVEAVLVRERFDALVERRCRRFYAPVMGRPSLSPGCYFRLLLLGYWEGIDSERGIAWRVQDSLSLREFLGYGLTEQTPDHSTLSRTRRLYPVETHQAGVRSYLPEPERGRRRWQGKPGKQTEQKRVYENRRRVHGRRGQDLQKLRSELTERSFAHMYETGGMRRTHLRKRKNILKRLLIHAAGFNLALLVRRKYGMGKPRTLQGVSGQLLIAPIALRTLYVLSLDLEANADGVSQVICCPNLRSAGNGGHIASLTEHRRVWRPAPCQPLPSGCPG